MGKVLTKKSLREYIEAMERRCTEKYGDGFVLENSDLIECAARNKKMLDRFDDEIDRQDLTMVSEGSTGQMKVDVNPIIKYRNDVAKLYADNLDALQLTPRSRYKKSEGKVSVESDPMKEYFMNLK